MKTAVVGGGFIGCAHVEALRRLGNVEIVALCDTYKTAEKANRLHIGRAYFDYQKMLDEQKPDVVHICTPNYTHYEIAKYALERGIHVVCEKPFTVTIAEAEELVELSEKTRVSGMVNFHNRMYPVAAQMKQMAAMGKIGKVISIHGSYIQDWLLYDTDYSWRLDIRHGGYTRAVSDIGSHWLDLVQYVSGLKIRKVCAKFLTVYPFRKKTIEATETFSIHSEKQLYEEVKIETEDTAVILLEFESGAIGSLTVSQVFAGKKNTMDLLIAGTESSMCWNTEQLNELFIGHRDRSNEYMTKDASLMCPQVSPLIGYPSGHTEGFPDALKNGFKQFYKSLEDGNVYQYASFADGLAAMRIVQAIYESAQTEKWVEV